MSRPLAHVEAVKLMTAAGLFPLENYPGLNSPWLCECMKCKREVSPRLGSVKRGSSGCAYCAGRKVDPNEAVEIMRNGGFEPLVPYPGNDAPWASVCKKCKRETSPRFHHVKSRGDKCKFCSGKVILVEDALREMDEKGLRPLVSFPGASKPWKSICKACGSKTSPRLADLRIGHSGCKSCAGKKGGLKRRLTNSPTRVGKTTTFDEVLDLMRMAYLEPLEPYATSQSKWKCKCLKCGMVVSPTFNSVRQGNGGCMSCSRLEQIGRGRLDESAAIAIMRGKNLEPLVPYPGAMIPWKSKCLDCGNFINPRYAHIQQGRKGCKFCAYKKNADERRTSQEEAIRVARASGFEPLEPYRGRHFPWKCKCMKCGENIAPHYAGIVTGGGCRFCSGLVIDPIEAANVMEKRNIHPLIPYPGAGKPWLSRCLKCNKEITPRYSSVNMGIGGCKYCATHGYDFSKSGILYLVTHEDFGSHKIGITNLNAKEKRLEKHLKKGWQTYRIQFYEDGNRAFEVEQEILVWWRSELGLAPYLSAIDMPQGGFTETVDANEIDLVSIWNQVEIIGKLLNSNGQKKILPKTTMPRKAKVRDS